VPRRQYCRHCHGYYCHHVTTCACVVLWMYQHAQDANSFLGSVLNAGSIADTEPPHNESMTDNPAESSHEVYHLFNITAV